MKQEITVPDLGTTGEVEVIELLVAPGELVQPDTPVVVLESDKATVEVPSPASGTVLEFVVGVGDKVTTGSTLLFLDAQASDKAFADVVAQTSAPTVVENSVPMSATALPEAAKMPVEATPSGAENAVSMTVDEDVHAGPAVRKMARELGVDLRRVNGSGPRHRILKDDLGGYIKDMVGRAQRGGAGKTIESAPLPDFSQFGEISVQPIERIHLLTAQGMLNSWAAAPQVTQFDEADITELEQFRKVEKATAERLGIKLTLLPFLLKACACALRELPQFNVSIDMARQQLIRKHYIHIGVAVDTRHGLFVPVLRDVDRKSVFELAQEIQDKAVRAAEKKLKPAEMQGGCFSISSLGSIGGTAFTPIVNVPEVAILGVSKARLQPVWSGDRFEPRLMLPLSLSYDHRAVNGADGAKFTTLLGWLLSDLRRLLLGAGSGVTGL